MLKKLRTVFAIFLASHCLLFGYVVKKPAEPLVRIGYPCAINEYESRLSLSEIKCPSRQLCWFSRSCSFFNPCTINENITRCCGLRNPGWLLCSFGGSCGLRNPSGLLCCCSGGSCGLRNQFIPSEYESWLSLSEINFPSRQLCCFSRNCSFFNPCTINENITRYFLGEIKSQYWMLSSSSFGCCGLRNPGWLLCSFGGSCGLRNPSGLLCCCSGGSCGLMNQFIPSEYESWLSLSEINFPSKQLCWFSRSCSFFNPCTINENITMSFLGESKFPFWIFSSSFRCCGLRNPGWLLCSFGGSCGLRNPSGLLCCCSGGSCGLRNQFIPSEYESWLSLSEINFPSRQLCCFSRSCSFFNPCTINENITMSFLGETKFPFWIFSSSFGCCGLRNPGWLLCSFGGSCGLRNPSGLLCCCSGGIFWVKLSPNIGCLAVVLLDVVVCVTQVGCFVLLVVV
ncbi:hypothetical protein Anas_04339, partial [Armadillidium nasatum]